jgi:hypothetical protein
MSLFDFSPVNPARMPKVDPQIAAALARMNPVAAGASLGQMPTPGGPVKGPGLMQRLMNNVMPTPGALQDAGLLTDEDISSAQRQGMLGLGASLLADSGPKLAQNYVTPMAAIGRGIQAMQGGYQGAVQSAAGMREGSLDYQAKKEELARRGQLRTARENIIKQYPMPTNGDRQSMLQWINSVLPHFIEANDEQTTTSLSEIYKSLGGQSSQVHNPQQLDLGNKVILRDPASGQVVGEFPKGPTPNNVRLGEMMTPAAQQRVESNIIGEFDRQTKDYVKAHEAWSQVKAVVDRARNGSHSPDDIVQLIDGISRLNNPGAVVRTGTVQLQLQKIGSAEQKLRMWLDRGAKGAWPSDVVEGIGRAAAQIAKEHQKQFTDLRKRAIARGNHYGLDYLDGVLPNTWADGVQDDSAPAGWHPPMALPGQIDPRLQGIPRKGQ